MNTHVVGHVESLWRYPVKSMRGEALPEAFVSFSGILGDRLYAVHNSAAPKAFPYLTARGRSLRTRAIERAHRMNTAAARGFSSDEQAIIARWLQHIIDLKEERP